MGITLDVSGPSLILKVLKGPGWETFRDDIKKLSDKRPIYKMINGQYLFSHWEVPVSELGNLLYRIKRSDILAISDKARNLLRSYDIATAPLDALPPLEGEIDWKRPPKYPEQETYIRINEDKTKLVLAPAPGLGKSFISLMRAKVLGGKKILVVGPSKSNFITWRGEIEKTTDWSVIKYHGTPAKRKKLKAELANYDVVYTTYTMLHELVDVPFDQIICDEAHNISHSSTKLFKKAKKLIQANPNAGLQLLSGTPIQHKPKDYWALTHLINSQIAGNEYAWAKRYEKVIKSITKRVPLRSGSEYQVDERGKVKTRLIEIPLQTAPQNLDELADKIKSFTFRLKRDGYVKFEDRIEIQMVEPTKDQLEMYRQAKEELQIDLSSGVLKLSKDILGRITRFLQICEGCFNLDESILSSGKLDYLFEELDQAEDKRIVWSRFKPITEILHKRYKDRSVIYNGDYSQTHKDVAIWNFQGCETPQDYKDWEKYNKCKFDSPGEADFLFGTIDKGCTAGLNLDRCCKQYFSSFSWNGGVNEQTAARIKRLNQMADEVYTEFVLVDIPRTKFEENAFKLVLANYATTLAILDGKEDLTHLKIQELMRLI